MNEHSPVSAAARDGNGADVLTPLWQRIFAVDHMHRPRPFRYGLALTLVLSSLLLRLSLDPMIGDRAPYIFFRAG